ncbi:type I polyketide synthase, partial [Micromonospora wenchangensis]|uniref:type I polyketide synthase n=1 Tax=Micromonospora wenchangensis TaxID=1185415 RepID=UPI003D703215
QTRTDTSPDLKAIGLSTVGHPFLDALVESAADGSLLLAGRLSPKAHPWLVEHAVGGRSLLTSAAYADMTAVAGSMAGHGSVRELTLEAPLVLDEREVAIQVVLNSPGEDGTRTVSLFSLGDDETWVRHATGSLTATGPAGETPPPTDWPPTGAEQVNLDDFYELVAAEGVEYGRAFQCLRSAWRTADEVFALIALDAPEQTDAARFGVHPVLLDAAVQAAYLLDPVSRRPFVWTGYRQEAVGATSARVHLTRQESGDADTQGVGITITDETGNPLAEATSLILRAAPAVADERRAGALYAVEWPVTPQPDRGAPDARFAVAGDDPLDVADMLTTARAKVVRAGLSAGPAAFDAVWISAAREPGIEIGTAVRRTLNGIVGLLRDWLGDERRAETRLAVVTRGAVAVADGERPDPVSSAVWGLVRSAQREHPGRITLIDVDQHQQSYRALPAALVGDETQIALRAGRMHVPALTRLPPPLVTAGFPTDGTVLVTGAPAGLGGVLTRHLVVRHGVRRVLFVSRRGQAADGADQLRAELAEYGAEVRLAACDVADRMALAALLQTVPAEQPIRAVVHTAAVLADSVVTSLDADRLDRTLRPKVDALVALHEETADLREFIVFSSASGTLGGPGMAAYAAGNAFADAFMGWRRAQGLPARSLAWGLWERAAGIAGRLDTTALDRMSRAGVAAMSQADALALFDDALLESERAMVVPLRLDVKVLRAADDDAAPLLARLIPKRSTPSTVGDRATQPEFIARMQTLPEGERRASVLELVSRTVAGVLRHTSIEAIAPDRALKEFGLDSLTAVELRNRLAAATRLRLSPTIAFDHPDISRLTDHLSELLVEAHSVPPEDAAAQVRRLAATFAHLPAEDRAGLVGQLRALVDDWSGSAARSEESTVLTDASDDEIFDYIDRRYGSSTMSQPSFEQLTGMQ